MPKLWSTEEALQLDRIRYLPRTLFDLVLVFVLFYFPSFFWGRGRCHPSPFIFHSFFIYVVNIHHHPRISPPSFDITYILLMMMK